MRKLQLAEDLALPPAVVTEKLAFLGRTGSGKTYAAQKLAELMHGAEAQFVVLDPVGVWYGLRLLADGKTPGLPVPVLGGLHGDIPLEASGGALVANLVVDRGVSVVLDVSQFESDTDKARFARDFADRFFFRKKAAPAAVHVFIEEAQEFVPQHPQHEEARMLHAFTRMLKIGRNFGIGASLISQRPQEVNKKVLNLAELLFAFQMTGPQERRTVEGWIAEKGIDEDIAGDLPKLAVGAPHVWSPAWLKISRVVQIAQKTTFDASSTPAVGAPATTARPLAPLDLERLRADMAATIERAKQEDPRELRRQLVEAKAALARAQTSPPGTSPPRASLPRASPIVKRVEIPVLKDAQIGRVEAAGARLEKLGDRLETVAKAAFKLGNELRYEIKAVGEGQAQRLSEARRPPAPAAPAPTPLGETPRGLSGAVTIDRGHLVITRSAVAVTRSETTARSPVARILAGLAWWQAAGVHQPTRYQVAFAARYTVNGHFNNHLGALRTEGLIDYVEQGTVTLTTAGQREAARYASGPAPTREELIARVREVLRTIPKLRIFDAIVAAGGPATREEVALKAGYTINGHFNNTLGALRSLGLVDYPQGGTVRLSRLFEDMV